MSQEQYSITELDARQRAKKADYELQDELKRAESIKLSEAEYIKDESSAAKQVAYEARETARRAQVSASRAAAELEPELRKLHNSTKYESNALYRKSRAARNNLMYDLADKLYDQATDLRDQSYDYEDQREDLMRKKRETYAVYRQSDDHFRYVYRVFEAALLNYEAILAKLESLEVDRNLKERSYRVARNDYYKAVVKRAGLPSRYYRLVVIKVNDEGETSVYYGGKDRPDGPGHGHINLSPVLAAITYKREPRQSHGSHNYISSEHPIEVQY